MKKTLLTMAATTAIVVGGLSVVSVASAQTEDPASTDTTTVEERNSTDGRRGGERRGHRGGGCDLDTAAETIGIEVEALRSALESGQSIAEVATDNSVDPDVVVEAMVADKADHLDEKVEDGRLTQDEADERLAEKAERITARVFDTETDIDADTEVEEDAETEDDSDTDTEDDSDTDTAEGEGS